MCNLGLRGGQILSFGSDAVGLLVKSALAEPATTSGCAARSSDAAREPRLRIDPQNLPA